jgi:hypothetical protein
MLFIISQAQTFCYAVWFSCFNVVPNRYASVTHLVQGLWKETCSFLPLAFSPRKPLVPCRVQVLNVFGVVFDKLMACHFTMASRPFLIHGMGATESILASATIMKGYKDGLIKSVVLPTPLQTRLSIPLIQKLCGYQTQPGRVKYNNKLVPVCAPPL